MWERPSSQAGGNDRFASRRRLRRRRILIALAFLTLLIIGGFIYGVHQSSVRISRVQIFGADQSLAEVATKAMQGKYFGIIPRDSIFFFPASRIRADILALHPDIAAVSLFRNGFTGLSIRISDRVAIARWCGLAPTSGVEEYCYVFDSSGIIFAAASTSTQTVNSARLYVPLAGDTQEPLRATLLHADKLPGAFDFARQLGTLGSLVTSVVIRGDEVDNFLISGTRVTYVLGHERDAYTALISASPNLHFSDGSLEYVDLRFDGKVYLKKRE